MSAAKTRQLPASIDAEKGILSSILLDPSCLDRITGITPKSFHHPAHGTIFHRLVEMRKVGTPVDLVTLTQDLADRNLLEQIGGATAVSELQYFILTAQNVSEYVDIVAEKARLRETIRTSTALVDAAYDERSPEELDEKAKAIPNAEPSISTIDGKPALRLPSDGHLVSDFASNLGDLLAGHGIFSRKGSAFTLDHDGQKLELASPAWLRTWVERHVVPYKLNTTQNGQIKLARTMPDDTARAVLVSPQFLEKIPSVERFHPCPMPWLRKDGKIELLGTGLDHESGTFTSDSGLTIEPDTIEGARKSLDTLLAEFAWPDDGGRSKAVHISSMLTVFAGGIMPMGSTRPVFLYVANAEGSGKTTLAQLAGIPYQSTPVETAPRDESEWQKKLLSAVISGRRLLLLDNVKGHLNSSALEAYTTSPYFSGRVLGASKEFTGEAGATVLITGNGLTVTPDLRRRTLFVELFLQELRAEDRMFRRMLDADSISKIRKDVLCALWGMVKAWDVAGRPPATHHNSSFPRWSSTIAGIVEFAGYGCPTAPAAIEGMGDTDTADFKCLVEYMELGRRYSFKELSSIAIDGGLFDRITAEVEDGELSSRAKTQLSKIFVRYDRRRITTDGRFLVEGKGHQRRYLQSKAA